MPPRMMIGTPSDGDPTGRLRSAVDLEAATLRAWFVPTLPDALIDKEAVARTIRPYLKLRDLTVIFAGRRWRILGSNMAQETTNDGLRGYSIALNSPSAGRVAQN